jgi:hypothetical protein
MIDSHGSPRNFQMLRRQTTYTKGDGTSFTLQPLPPDSTPRTGVFDLMYWTLRSPFGLHLYGLERHPVTNDKIIHLGSWW